MSTLRFRRQGSRAATGQTSMDRTPPAMSETARPRKIGSNKITPPPTPTAVAVSRIGPKRTRPASTTACASVRPSPSRGSIEGTLLLADLVECRPAAGFRGRSSVAHASTACGRFDIMVTEP